MDRHQRYLFEMLKEIKAICVKNDIQFFLGGGTLIGALRNDGFLPWDDDIDVVMTYENWERFKLACKTDLPANRHLGSPDLSDTYGHLVPRYVSKDTTAIHSCQSLHDDIAGEVIDIFVLDPVSSVDEFESYRQDVFLYSAIVNYANICARKIELDPELYLEFHMMAQEKGRRCVVEMLEERLASHFSDEGRYYAYRWQGVCVLVERSWFAETVDAYFEGEIMPIPSGAPEFLSFWFGDEWAEVPSAINPAKHNMAASLDFPYTEALELFKPTFNRKALLDAMEKRKYDVLKRAPEKNWLRDEAARTRARVLEAEVSKAIDANPALFDSDSPADRRQLERRIDRYIDVQSSTDLIGRRTMTFFYRFINPVIAHVDVRMFELSLEELIVRGNIHTAARLLEQWAASDGQMTPRIDEIAACIRDSRELRSDYFHGRFLQGRDKAAQLVKSWPQVSAFHWLLCACLNEVQKESGNEADKNALRDAADEGARLFPTDGRFAKAKADYLRSIGKPNEAQTLELRAAESTRDGLVLNDIAKNTGYHPTWLRNPDWALRVGVPQWDGEDPKPLSSDLTGENSQEPAPDECQEYILGLLSEVADACDKLDIPYVLGPALTKSLTSGLPLPNSDACYSIICDSEGYLRLIDELTSKAPSNRRLSYMGNDAHIRGLSARYYGTDSLLVHMDEICANENSMLYVSIVPLEPKRYPQLVKLMLRNYGRGVDSEFKPTRLPVRAISRLYGLGKDRALAGKRLFDIAFNVKVPKDCIRTDGAKTPFHASMLDNTHLATYGTHEFRIVADADDYCQNISNKLFGGAFCPGSLCIASAFLTFEEFQEKNLLDASYYDRNQKAKAAGAKSGRIFKRFRKNFRELKRAVALKQEAFEAGA